MPTLQRLAVAFTVAAAFAVTPAAARPEPKREKWASTSTALRSEVYALQAAGSYAEAAAALRAYVAAWQPKLAPNEPIYCEPVRGVFPSREQCRRNLGDTTSRMEKDAARYEALDAAQRRMQVDPKGAARPLLKLILEQAAPAASASERRRIFVHLAAHDAALAAFAGKHFPATLDVQVDPRFEEAGRLAFMTQLERAGHEHGMRLGRDGASKALFQVRSKSELRDEKKGLLADSPMKTYEMATAVELVDAEGKSVLQLGVPHALLGISWTAVAGKTGPHADKILDAVVTELLMRVDRGDL